MSQFHISLPWVDTLLAQCLNIVSNVKAQVVIVKTDGSFAALVLVCSCSKLLKN